MKNRVSVIIPAYNSANLLPDAIRSVRQQKWPDLQIIVVDDGSVDDTSRVLNELLGDDLIVLRQPNGGPAAARNKGIEAARGDWIAFLDADDLWLPGKLEAQMTALETDPAFAFSYADAVCCDPGGLERPQRARAVHGRIFLDLLLGPQFGTGSVIVRRGCFDCVGLFDTGLRTGEDWDMWLRIAARYSSCYVPKTLWVYRKSDQSGKYPLELLESCTLRILERTLARSDTVEQWSEIIALRGKLYAWHYSVLAKSHLRQGRVSSFCRLALASISSHPAGAYFLARRWGMGGAFPNIFPEITCGMRCTG